MEGSARAASRSVSSTHVSKTIAACSSAPADPSATAAVTTSLMPTSAARASAARRRRVRGASVDTSAHGLALSSAAERDLRHADAILRLAMSSGSSPLTMRDDASSVATTESLHASKSGARNRASTTGAAVGLRLPCAVCVGGAWAWACACACACASVGSPSAVVGASADAKHPLVAAAVAPPLAPAALLAATAYRNVSRDCAASALMPGTCPTLVVVEVVGVGVGVAMVADTHADAASPREISMAAQPSHLVARLAPGWSHGRERAKPPTHEAGIPPQANETRDFRVFRV